jgi:hypothetical protein
MTSVLFAVDVDELLLPELGALVEEHAPTPAVSRPTAATAMSFLELRWLMLMFTFPVLCLISRLVWGSLI